MTYRILRELTESRLYPSRQRLEKEDFEKLSQAVYLMILALRILLVKDHHYAETFVNKTIRHNGFDEWSGDGNDLYVAMYALTNGHYDHDGHVPESLNGSAILRWLRHAKKDHDRETETKRLFARLDSMLWINDPSMKALRRQVQDWTHLSEADKKLALAHLIRMMRVKILKAELLPPLRDLARERHWGDDDEAPHLPDVPKSYRDPRKPHRSDRDVGSLLGTLATLDTPRIAENASSGATASANVATAVKPLGGEALGPGFGGNGKKYPYGSTKPVVIRRNNPK